MRTPDRKKLCRDKEEIPPTQTRKHQKNERLHHTMCSLIPLLSEDDRAEHGFHRRLISGVEVGAEAVRMLYWRLAHPDAPQRRLVLNTALVVGESARAIG